MKIIHRYIMAEIAGPFLIGVFTLTAAILLQRFSRLADLVLAKGVPAALVGQIVAALLPYLLAITLPAALLLAVLLATGRLTADSEITALQSAGIGMRRIAPPVAAVSALAFLIALFIAWEGIPWGQRRLAATLSRILAIRAGAGASERVFQEIAPGVLLFADRVTADGTRMSGVLLSQQVAGREPLLVLAREGSFLPENPDTGVGLHLEDGAVHQDDEAGSIYRYAEFSRMEFRLPKPAAAAGTGDDPRLLTIPQLVRRIAGPGGAASAVRDRYQLHKRLGLAASCLAFGLLALPLGLSQRARGKSPAFAMTIGVVLAYYLFLAAGGAVMATSPALMIALLWLPNALSLAGALWALWASESRAVGVPALFAGRSGRR